MTVDGIARRGAGLAGRRIRDRDRRDDRSAAGFVGDMSLQRSDLVRGG